MQWCVWMLLAVVAAEDTVETINSNHWYKGLLDNEVNQTKVYAYPVPNLDFVEEDISLDFKLTVESGPAPSMIVYYCEEFKDMPIREQAIESCSAVMANKTNEELWHEETGPGKQMKVLRASNKTIDIHFDHNETTCNNNTEYHCVYVVAVT